MTADATEYGQVVSVRGGVVDILFPRQLPQVNYLLTTGDGNDILLEVALHLDERHVRAVALTPTRGLAREAEVRSLGRTLLAPVGPGTLGRVFNVFGEPIDGKGKVEQTELRPIHGKRVPLIERSTKSQIFEVSST